MKTSIKTLLTLLIVSLVMGVGTVATAADKNTTSANNVSTTIAIKNIERLEVAGNVEVILVQGRNESVKVHDAYYPKNALVQQQDGVLRISSFDKEQLTVTITVDHLSSIMASNTATVRTHGKFSLLSLSVTLTGEATADINATTINLSTNVSDLAKIRITGNTEEFTGVIGMNAAMNLDNFKAMASTVRSAGNNYALRQTAANAF